ncbi:hypothetical protein [Streptomyces mirabilis]|uniref:hypothetical protein n=1 Tax=Streptomyces mirabilis TaxID=68239 RepID=UPI003321906D
MALAQMVVLGRAFVLRALVGADCCCGRYARRRAGRRRTGREASGTVMISVDAGSGDRLALAVLTQYRMATTQQMSADQELQCGPPAGAVAIPGYGPLPNLRGNASPDES